MATANSPRNRRPTGLSRIDSTTGNDLTISLKTQRAGSPSARSELFLSADPAKWRRVLSFYPRVLQELVRRKKKEGDREKVLGLDQWFQEDLPALFLTRTEDPHLTGSELSKVMQWKLSRGSFRPRLQQMVDSIPNNKVVEVTRTAFGFISGPGSSKAVIKGGREGPSYRAAFRKALETLTGELKGVGPATASALLCAITPTTAPFFADEAAEAVLTNEKIAYTTAYYLRFVEGVQKKCRELEEVVDCDSSLTPLTPHDVEKALWCHALARRFGMEIPTEKDHLSDNETGTKRKRVMSDPTVLEANSERAKTRKKTAK